MTFIDSEPESRAILGLVEILSQILPTSIQDGYYYACFTDKDAASERLTCPRSPDVSLEILYPLTALGTVHCAQAVTSHVLWFKSWLSHLLAV